MSGLDLKKMIFSLLGIPSYIVSYFQFRNMNHQKIKYSFLPCLHDKHTESGSAHGHYFHMDLWVAQRIHQNKPQLHVDFGSRVDGFVAHVASFRQIEVFDIRQLTSVHDAIIFKQMDLSKNQLPTNYCDSLSSLHVVEHIGLGRYGDSIDPDGAVKAFDQLANILKLNGTLFFAIPFGRPQIVFNAHRVFSMHELLKMIEPRFKIVNFKYVDDEGQFCSFDHSVSELKKYPFDFDYGCAIFELVKVQPV